MFVKHQMIVQDSIEEREYQMTIARTCVKKSTMVVLGTGLGKTVVALLVIAETLRTKKGKILFMAPTKPLVEQHARFLEKFLIAEKPAVFTGEVMPSKRTEVWKSSQIIAATPQVIANDLISGQMDLNDFSLVIFDEVHRAVGDYAYVFIGERYRKVKGGHVMGMTASPSNDSKKILEICENLGFEAVEIRHDYDPDVVKYVHDVYIKWLEIDVPAQLKPVIQHLKAAQEEQLAFLRKLGYLQKKPYATTKDLLAAQRAIQASLQSGARTPSAFTASTTAAMALSIANAIVVAETQGAASIRACLDEMMKKAVSKGATRAAKQTIALPKVQMALLALREVESAKIETPKLEKVKDIVYAQIRAKPDSRIIVFTHYRDTSELVSDALSKIKGVMPARFVGQASKGADKGLRQKQQVELIDRFKSGDINVLVATSVGEEGLDIPATDLVIFYEPVPSEIRTIQRRGRTGRRRSGKVFVLIYKGTRDVAYYWSSKHKETKMHRELERLRKDLKSNIQVGGPVGSAFQSAASQSEKKEEAEQMPEIEMKQEPVKKEEPAREEEKPTARGAAPQATIPKAAPRPVERSQRSLADFGARGVEKLKIIADKREFNSSVVRQLASREVIIESVQLDVGDYLISERIGVERKEVDDFLASLMDGRLFQQAKALTRAYQAPLMILEGEGLVGRRNISPDAIYGALASLTTDFGLTILSSKNETETANILLALAKRELAEGKTPGIRGEKGTMLLQERQQFIIEGLPGVSGILAQRLLAHFGSVKAVLEASEEELQKVKGIGKGIAKSIREAVDSKYYSKESE